MLTDELLLAIEELQGECEAADDIKLKLNWDMLRVRNENEQNDYFYYENGKLAGFLALYGFGSKIEVCGMVAPAYRRRGIFSSLMQEALGEIRNRNADTVLLNAPANSETAKSFLKSMDCTYQFSEYQMKWNQTELLGQNEVNLRTAAGKADMEAEIQLDVQCFGISEEDAKEFFDQVRKEDDHSFYMIEAEGNTVGKIRVSHTNGEAWIYGFAIFPEYQGKGFGRKALTTIILQEAEAGFPVFLEVEARNAHALKLYESCGFRAYQSQDYYLLQDKKLISKTGE